MGFVALVLALIAEQLRPLPRDNPVHRASASVADAIVETTDAGQWRHGALGWTLAVGVAVLGVALTEALLARVGVLAVLALHVAVLYHTVGFRQFSHAFTEIQLALAASDVEGARQVLQRWIRLRDPHFVVADLPVDELCRIAIGHALIAAHRHVFGPLFWYLLLPGAIGPVLYRAAQFVAERWSRDDRPNVEADATRPARIDLDIDVGAARSSPVRPSSSSSLSESLSTAPSAASAAASDAGADPYAAATAAPRLSVAARAPDEASDRPASADDYGRFATRAYRWIDWLPVRMSAIGFAVVGNFEDAVYCWRAASAVRGGDVQRRLLLMAGSGALGLRIADARVEAEVRGDAAALDADPSLSGGVPAGFDWTGSPPDASGLRSAVGLVWRSVVLWIGLFAMLTIAGWSGR